MERFLVNLIITIKRILIRAYAFRSTVEKRTTVVAIGDSWLNLTLFSWFSPSEWKLKFKKVDTIDWLKHSGEFNIVDCGIPGYKLVNEVEFKLFRDALDAMRGDNFVVLLSFGGNDLTADFCRFVEGFGGKAKVNKKLLKKFLSTIYFDYLRFYLDLFYTELKTLNIKRSKRHLRDHVKIFIHGYDYFRPDVRVKGVLHERFAKLFDHHRMTADQAKKVARDFVDVTNVELKAFCKKHHMRFIDLRGVLEDNEWVEAIHPTPDGYRKISEIISGAIRTAR